jgi:small subunit ribosomal protein S20
MANHPSAEKRNRQRIRRTDRNRSVKGAVRTLLKKARAAIAAAGAKPGDSDAAVAAAIKAVDRAASKGVVHPKMAARSKSRLAKAAHKRTKTATA